MSTSPKPISENAQRNYLGIIDHAIKTGTIPTLHATNRGRALMFSATGEAPSTRRVAVGN
jgi:hypothetical protein